jgi:Tfp pilus assembly protein PilF
MTCLAACASLAGCHTGASPEDQLRVELEQRRELHQRSDDLCQSAMLAISRGETESARGMLLKAVDIDGRNPRAWMLLGKVELGDDRLFEAAKAFHAACRVMPYRYEPHYNLGCVFEAGGQPSRAAVEYEAALELAPDQLEVMENLARCYIDLGEKHERAAELIGRSLRTELRPEWILWLQQQQKKLSTRVGRVP